MVSLETKYCHKGTSDQISRSVVSDSLRPHESQHARPPCPSPEGTYQRINFFFSNLFLSISRSVGVLHKFVCVTLFRFHMSVILYGICLSFSDFLLNMIISSCIHVAANGIVSPYLWLSNIPLYILPHLLYPFLFQWTFRLFPCLGDCK